MKARPRPQPKAGTIFLRRMATMSLGVYEDKSPRLVTGDADADATAAYERENAEAAEALDDEYSKAAKKE